MDEYLFIVLAKLKADRLQLERQQRHAAVSDPDSGQRDFFETSQAAAQHRSPKARWFSPQSDWPVRT